MSRLRASRLPVPAGTIPTGMPVPASSSHTARMVPSPPIASDEVTAAHRRLVRHPVAGVLDGGLPPRHRGEAGVLGQRLHHHPELPEVVDLDRVEDDGELLARVGHRLGERLVDQRDRPRRRVVERQPGEHHPGTQQVARRPRRRSCARRGRSGRRRRAGPSPAASTSTRRRTPRRRTSIRVSTIATPIAPTIPEAWPEGKEKLSSTCEGSVPDGSLATDQLLDQRGGDARRVDITPTVQSAARRCFFAASAIAAISGRDRLGSVEVARPR